MNDNTKDSKKISHIPVMSNLAWLTIFALSFFRTLFRTRLSPMSLQGKKKRILKENSSDRKKKRKKDIQKTSRKKEKEEREREREHRDTKTH